MGPDLRSARQPHVADSIQSKCHHHRTSGPASHRRVMSTDVVVNNPEALQVAKMLGARQAMSLVAGRCSAADAEMLCQIHDGKKYLSLSESWEAFCQQHLPMSRRHADRTIRLFKELGPAYFELSQ